MIFPSINDLSKGKYNKYMLVIATAKCARVITDEYVMQREFAEKKIASKETDKSIAALIKKEYRDEKAVKTAVNRLYEGRFEILEGGEEAVEAEEAEEAVDAE
jgi:DNA-directed RNA polymerase subunit K/omega